MLNGSFIWFSWLSMNGNVSFVRPGPKERLEHFRFKGFMNKATSTNHGVGRRKSSIARVWLKPGTGKVIVNGKNYKEYFDTPLTRSAAIFPLKVCGMDKTCDAKISVVGGGMVGQAGAIKLGIARALLSLNESLKKTLRQHDLLTVDSRVKERKKYGQKGARRRFQFVKR